MQEQRLLLGLGVATATYIKVRFGPTSVINAYIDEYQ